MNTLRLFVTLMLGGLCEAKISEVPLPENVQKCYDKVQDADTNTYVGNLFGWMCESKIRHSELGKHVQWDAKKLSYYKRLLKSASPPNNTDGGATVPRRKRQATQTPCVRQEYRMLSDDRRTRYHNAVNALKQDTSVEPNKYDAIALLHVLYASTAHLGDGFLGWHRLYMNMFEAAMQEVDPSVCLPYWDTSLESELGDPALSNLWTPEFMGTPNGPVVDGPFANWNTPNGGPLIRNVDSRVDLVTATNIRNILTRTGYEQITFSRARPRYNLEIFHGGPHVHIGGAMSQVDTAPFDPIFFLYHAFIDHIWELFRARLRSIGRDPERYPNIEPPDSPHYRSAPTGFDNLLQEDAYRDEFSERFVYEPAPTCSARRPQCGSRYLTCRVSIGRCVPTTAGTARSSPPGPTITQNEAVPLALLSDSTVTQSPVVPETQLPGGAASDTRCLKPEKSLGQAIQNDFCCDNTCDINDWVMIPVKIISVRPPMFNKYKSYPVHKGRIDSHYDIYSPRAYNQTNRFITQRRSNPKTYKRCRRDENVGQVLLSSRGINYHGFYEEAAMIDQRLAVSMSLGYVAVKKPVGATVSTAIIRAHDSCGRVCKAACMNPLTGKYNECKGAIGVSADQPLMYGPSYDEAVMSVFDYEYNSQLPQFTTNNLFITFYCDYESKFPYTNYSSDGVTRPPEAVTTPAVVAPPSKTECVVTPQCILDIPCASTEYQCTLHSEKHICRGSCQTYAVCMYGHFFVKVCPDGQSFDNVNKICVPGGCR